MILSEHEWVREMENQRASDAALGSLIELLTWDERPLPFVHPDVVRHLSLLGFEEEWAEASDAGTSDAHAVVIFLHMVQAVSAAELERPVSLPTLHGLRATLLEEESEEDEEKPQERPDNMPALHDLQLAAENRCQDVDPVLGAGVGEGGFVRSVDCMQLN